MICPRALLWLLAAAAPSAAIRRVKQALLQACTEEVQKSCDDGAAQCGASPTGNPQCTDGLANCRAAGCVIAPGWDQYQATAPCTPESQKKCDDGATACADDPLFPAANDTTNCTTALEWCSITNGCTLAAGWAQFSEAIECTPANQSACDAWAADCAKLDNESPECNEGLKICGPTKNCILVIGWGHYQAVAKSCGPQDQWTCDQAGLDCGGLVEPIIQCNDGLAWCKETKGCSLVPGWFRYETLMKGENEAAWRGVSGSIILCGLVVVGCLGWLASTTLSGQRA